MQAMLEEALRTLAGGQSLDPDAQRDILTTMLELTKDARKDYRVWDDFFAVTEHARKLSDTERKREEMLQSNLTAAQSIALFTKLFEIIGTRITDEPTRKAVAGDLEQFLLDRKLRLAQPAEIVQ
jgi:hypothetical protein